MNWITATIIPMAALNIIAIIEMIFALCETFKAERAISLAS